MITFITYESEDSTRLAEIQRRTLRSWTVRCTRSTSAAGFVAQSYPYRHVASLIRAQQVARLWVDQGKLK
jgi:hypothetical protein